MNSISSYKTLEHAECMHDNSWLEDIMSFHTNNTYQLYCITLPRSTNTERYFWDAHATKSFHFYTSSSKSIRAIMGSIDESSNDAIRAHYYLHWFLFQQFTINDCWLRLAFHESNTRRAYNGIHFSSISYYLLPFITSIIKILSRIWCMSPAGYYKNTRISEAAQKGQSLPTP